jgi:hypothetical protein
MLMHDNERKQMKIVINSDYGGFGLSDDAIRMYADMVGIKLYEEKGTSFTHFYKDATKKKDYFFDQDIPRDDENLVKVVETLGVEANGRFSELKIVEIPDDVNWMIMENDGREWVAERHRTWE